MNKCYRCGRGEDEVHLYEAVHPTGRVFVCESCYSKFKMPLIEKKYVDWDSLEKSESVRERLAKIAHVDLNHRSVKVIEKNPNDVSLRDIVEKNFEKNKLSSNSYPKEVVRNFHWVIIRKRRHLKMSQDEFARKLFLPLKVVQSLEKGILSNDYKEILKKVENVLGISLFTKKDSEISSEDILNEAKNPTGILVADVKKPKKFWNFFKSSKKQNDNSENSSLENPDKEEKVFEANEIRKQSKKDDSFRRKDLVKKEVQGKSRFKNETLSQKDMDKLIWGK